MSSGNVHILYCIEGNRLDVYIVSGASLNSLLIGSDLVVSLSVLSAAVDDLVGGLRSLGIGAVQVESYAF